MTTDNKPSYRTENGVTVYQGDLVYDYYSMEPVEIGRPSGSDGWFDSVQPGSVTDERPYGVRSHAGMLDGSRICTIEYARRRGFAGA